MEESILKFNEQFDYNPEIVGAEKLKNNYEHYILGGMGGSHLGGGVLHYCRPGIDLYIHRDYGIPPYSEDFCNKSLFIACSYSGNTEEILDYLDEAYSKGYDVLVISTGGKLIDFAIKNEIPYIKIPDTGIQPRMATGFLTIALSYVVSKDSLDELEGLKESIEPEELKEEGESIANSLRGKIPVIYVSDKNRAVAYCWKIKMNETAKVPAFYNVIPELNHNEMQGYDFVEANKNLSENFHFIVIHDSEDSPRVAKRMEVLEEIFQGKGLPVTRLYLEGLNSFEKIFKSLLTADWTALMLDKYYGTEPEQVPLIEEFKKKIAS